ncbi:hypothetical protein K431DRAFT_320560 [Polychaeton citri CBS 116435]|uniref:Zn(2)-C6 fungal-type domain-containing protein n=1 Tax=Polychaeton citri CBS 116435 TaxID=1314669 RepID=A0A9P4Q7T0_9PEZI|nr:hypothetical protein K431DRAFT_320560 [Polychaeton citri CBS 116435]
MSSASNTPHGTKRSASPSESPHEHQGRQRSRAACAPCRQRKRKCDGKLPCATCVRYEYQCEYSNPKRSSLGHNGDIGAHPPEPKAPAETHPSIIQLQAHPLTAPGARFHHRSILDPTKTRFVRANSAIAFPRILGMDLESDTIPRLHSFAWHLGIRAEDRADPVDLTSMLTLADMQRLAGVYFTIVKPEIGLLDEADFLEQVQSRFAQPSGFHEHDAVALYVAALGSFFSATPHPREHDFLLSARQLLWQQIVYMPTFNSIASWILRGFYLRLTSRPHASWLSSCIAMHQAEAAGLFKEMQTIAVVYPQPPVGDHKLAKLRRRLFWIARSFNVIFSYEFGRSRVNFDVITTKKFAPDSGGHAHELVELADLLPSDFVDRDREPDPPSALGLALTKIEELQTDSHFITLLRADLAFAIYRRLWLMSLTDAKDRAETVIQIGKKALIAAEKLLELRRPWWNIIHATFQLICVVLAVNTPKSLAVISDAMRILDKIARTYDTHMVREAYNQAQALVQMARKRKEKEMAALNAVPSEAPFEAVDHPSAGSSRGMTDAPTLDWAKDLDFQWDIFLNPELIMSGQQPQSAVDAAFGGQLGFQNMGGI